MAYPEHNDTVVVLFKESPWRPDTTVPIPANVWLKARYDNQYGEWLWVEWNGVRCLISLYGVKRPIIVKYVGDKK